MELNDHASFPDLLLSDSVFGTTGLFVLLSLVDMIRKFQPIILSLFLTAVLCFIFCRTEAQDYFIEGPSEVPCQLEQYFFISTQHHLINTVWQFTPDVIILDSNTYRVNALFFAPGTYILISTSTTANDPNNHIISDTFFITVTANLEGIENLSCYEINPVTGCHKVCASHPTLIRIPQGTSEFSVTGEDSYNYYLDYSTIEIHWGPGGTGSVSVYEGCYSPICFEIIPQAVADFSTLPQLINDTVTVCEGQEIQFTNESFNGLNYIWQFSDGVQTNGYDANHSFKEAGYYTVTLIAENTCDCSAQKQIVVEVLPAPAPTLDCVNTICEETRQKYTATTDGCTVFEWSISANGTIISGGGPSDDFIEIIWHQGPEGLIELAVSGCASMLCSEANTFRIPIISPSSVIEGDDRICYGEVVTYTAPYFPGTQYQWIVGPKGTLLGGQNTNGITVRWDKVGTVTPSFVSVEYDNCFLECAGEGLLNVAITPAITIIGDIQVCQNTSASVEAKAGFYPLFPANVQWHIENAEGDIVFSLPGLTSGFTHTFSYPEGEYVWVATNASSSYCTEEVRQKIQVTAIPPPPLGISGETHICPGQPYGFSIDNSGNYSTNWTVIDGLNTYEYSGPSIEHTFGNIPPFIVQAAHSDIQYKDCISAFISISLQTAEVLAIEGAEEVCFNGINEYTIPYINGSEYLWEIIPAENGEIRKSNLNQVEVFWTKTGPASLQVTTCGIILEKNVTVHALPSFAVTGPMEICANELASIATDQPGYNYTWLKDDDTFISNLNAVTISAGIYKVTAEDGYGCENKQSFQITELPVPSIHITTASRTTFCNFIPPGVELVANTDGSDYSFRWYKDDVSLGSGGAKLIVTDFGSYHAEVINQHGCSALSLKITFTDCCAPADCFGPVGPPGCTYAGHDFDIEVTGAECQSKQYNPLWPDITPDETFWIVSSSSLGIINIVDADILLQNYSYPGFYQVTMVGKLNGFPYSPLVCGHIQPINDTVRAVADFKFIDGCMGKMIAFEDLTTFLPDESIATWQWDFGDPLSGSDNTSSLQNPGHIYSTAGDYDVTLMVTLTSGCTTSKSLKIQIYAGPTLLPEYDPVFCQREALAFQLPGDLFDIAWDFGDAGSGIQNTAGSDSVFHTYETPGIYSVTLSAADSRKCINQTSISVDIRLNTLAGDITINPLTYFCDGDTTVLTAPPGGTNWLWSTEETTEQIQVTETNQFNLLVTDQFQCTYAPPPVYIAFHSPPEIIIKAREILGHDHYGPWDTALQICEGKEFEIQVFSQTINVFYYWLHGIDGEKLSFTEEAGNLPGPGTHQFSVIGSGDCSTDIFSIDIEIIPLPDIPQIILISGSGCSYNENILEVTNPEPGMEYLWSNGQKGISILAENEGVYFVTAHNSFGCSSESNTVQILASSDVGQIPGGCHIACDPLSVCLPPLTDVVHYNLYLNNTIYQSGTVWPSEIILTEDGSYTFEITSANGCISQSEPLDIVLYTGTGNITVLTYFDTDGDGMLGGADELLPGIPVNIISNDGLHGGETYTNDQAQFVFEDFPASVYTVVVNQLLLSSQWKIIIDSVQGEIITCGDSIIVSLLLSENCFVTGPDIHFEICPGEIISLGDSLWSDTGQYIMHSISESGCDSTFNVHIQYNDTLEINGIVWVDLDFNGIVSPADTMAPAISLILENLVTAVQYVSTSGTPDQFPSGSYTISIDTSLFTGQFDIIVGINEVSDTACGAVQVNFLVVPSCAEVQLVQQIFICPVDSVFIEDSWISEAGVYTFQITEPGAICDTVLDVYIFEYMPMIAYATTSWNCSDLGSISLTIEGEGPFQFDWGFETDGDSTISGLTAGDYTIHIYDIHGCVMTDSFSITEPEPFEFYIDDSFEVTLGDSILVSVTGDTDMPDIIYHWFPDGILSCSNCQSSYVHPIEDIMLTIEITDTSQCIHTLVTNIVVSYIDTLIPDAIYAPNVFSPNGDNINDVFTFHGRLPGIYLYELMILDRWGETVFSTSNIDLDAFGGWNGNFRNQALNPQVFVYYARVRLSDGKEVKLRGDVTLVR